VRLHISGGVGCTPIPSSISDRVGGALAASRPERMQAIDAARGFAMVLVCVSHVRVHFAEDAPTLYFLLTSITRIATPTFLLLSGFVAAYVLANGGRHARLTLIDRGLFVLLLGHVLLNLEDLRSTPLEQWILSRVTVTDAIGVCLMFAAALYRLPAIALGLLGAALALFSWPIAMTQTFESQIARYAGAALFNLRSEADALIDAAIVPYLGLFAIGMALSKANFACLKRGDLQPVARRMALGGIAALSLVTIALAIWFTLKRFELIPSDPAWSGFVQKTLDPRSKLPPGPAYLLFYGGCGLLLTAWCLIAQLRVLMRPVINWASTLGRASLMCFIVQSWILKLVPAVLQFENSTSIAFWTAYLFLALAVIHWLASKWDAIGANRFLTLGLRNLGQAHRPHMR
jgi:uncharacterized membrane protein